MNCAETNVPELDASAQKMNLRMTEGDPINFQWLVLEGANWVGDYVWSVAVVGEVVVMSAECTVDGTDGLFVIQGAYDPALAPSQSGWQWDLQAVDGPTRFAGSLFVEAQIA